MDKLKVAFLDFWPEIKDENIFLPILQKHFEVEVTSSNPDVIIHSIFGGMTQSPKFKCKKILFIGENYRAANYPCDYSISFDPHTDKNYRLPLWQYYLILRPQLKDILFGPRVNHEKFDRGVSFVVSNPNNFFRNGFFNLFQFSSWIQSFSYGRYKNNNRELQNITNGRYWRDVKYEFFLQKKHQFSICFEHSSYPYYCTEKLMDAFLAGSMPLYWGDPRVKEDWNQEAFINVGKIGQQEAFNLVRKMTLDDKVFREMYEKPIFTDEQKERHLANIKLFEYWLIEKIKT